MTRPGSPGGRLHALSALVQKKYCRNGLILAYHRVSAAPAVPPLLCVTADHFARQMEYLSENFCPVPLPGLQQRIRDQESGKPRCVAVTFDDGYADFLWHARPVLERCGIPVTLFIAGSMPGAGREYWWDELERLLLGPEELPGRLDLAIGGHHHCWLLNDQPATGRDSGPLPAGVSPLPTAGDPPAPGAAPPGIPAARYRAFCDLNRLLTPLAPDACDQVLQEIRRQSGLPEACRPEMRVIGPDEIRDLAAGGLFEIGAHTMRHAMLSRLSPANQQQEIAGSRRALEELLDRPVQSFAYPFGYYGDFTRESVALVRKAGFSRACTCCAGPVSRWTDRFLLPRYIAGDWDVQQFGTRLSRWLTV